jgi:hypothetical protein
VLSVRVWLSVQVDFELWDVDATHMIGQATLSIARLLAGEERDLSQVIALSLPGREPVGSVRVTIEARELVGGQPRVGAVG